MICFTRPVVDTSTVFAVPLRWKRMASTQLKTQHPHEHFFRKTHKRRKDKRDKRVGSYMGYQETSLQNIVVSKKMEKSNKSKPNDFNHERIGGGRR